MEVNLAIKLTHLVNTQTEQLKEYAEYRIARLLVSLEKATTVEELNTIKGSLAEVRRLITLRDEVIRAREG